MESFTQKTKIDLPDIRKRQTYKNKEKEIDYFNLLFEDNSEAENALLGSVRQKTKFLQGYQFYFAIVFVLFIAACFLVVQMVVNSPEVEKYKAATKNIEEIDTEDESEESDTKLMLKDKEPVIAKTTNLIPEVSFENDVVKPVKKPINVVKKPKQITIIKQSHVIIQKPSLIIKNQDLSKKAVEAIPAIGEARQRRHELPQQAVSDIMLRPFVMFSEPALRGLD